MPAARSTGLLMNRAGAEVLPDVPSQRCLTMSKTISIARDFSRFPAGRYRADGPFSGEQFRDDKLAPALSQNPKVIVDLDGALGYGSSFLEEAFGGLVREKGFRAEDLQTKLELRSSESSLPKEIWGYIRNWVPVVGLSALT